MSCLGVRVRLGGMEVGRNGRNGRNGREGGEKGGKASREASKKRLGREEICKITSKKVTDSQSIARYPASGWECMNWVSRVKKSKVPYVN